MKQTTINDSKIPEYGTHVTQTLENAGFESFLVGGCVRDLIIGREPKDWDITTNAKPEEIIPLFDKTIYENTYGTVGVCIPITTNDGNVNVSRVTLNSVIHETTTDVTRQNDDVVLAHVTKYNIIEVTTYRIETKYGDFRHPDEIKFSDKIDEDLKRRDFTINAMAYNPSKGQLIDLYGGIKDIKDKVIRAVGNPVDRFHEDALRMLRAIRFSSQINYAISYDTTQAVVDNSNLIKNVSFERIQDEFTKIIMSDSSASGVAILQKLNLLKYIIPELEEGIGCEQGGAHIYPVFEHLLEALNHASKKGWPLEIRLAALFHDIGKPKSRRNTEPAATETNLSGPRSNSPDHAKSLPVAAGRKKYTFYGHEVVGARIAKQIMERLKYPKKTTELVVSLVRNHMFFSDTEMITLSAVRRIVQRVGKEHIWELMQVRECDRVGMDKKEAPYRLRKYHA